MPLQTFRADISYAEMTAFTGYGTIGVKVWINRGEIKREEAEEPGRKRAPAGAAKRRKRASLAEKAKKQRVKPSEIKKD